MEFKIDNWEITKNSKYNVRGAYDNNKFYLCKGPLDKVSYDKIKWYDELKDYNLPLLPIVETLLDNNKFFIIFKEATPMNSLEHFSSGKIINFIIKIAKLHYETNYSLINNCLDNLFISNGKIYFNPFNIEKEYFDVNVYLHTVKKIFNKYDNKEICKKLEHFNHLYLQDKDLENLKKILLSLI